MESKLSYDDLWSIVKINNIGIVIYEVHDNGSDFIIKYIKGSVEYIKNLKKDKIIGQKVTKNFPKNKEFCLIDALRMVWKSGNDEHYPTASYKDGKICGLIDNHIIKLSSSIIVAIHADETQGEKNNKSINESEIFFQTIFDTIQDGITVLDNNLNIVKMNKAMERWYVPKRPYLGKKCYNIYHSKQSFCNDCPAKEAIESGLPKTRTVNR